MCSNLKRLMEENIESLVGAILKYVNNINACSYFTVDKEYEIIRIEGVNMLKNG